LAFSVVLGICNVVLTIAQAVLLAHALGSLFSHSGAPIRGDLILLAILAVTRGLVSLASEPITSRLARPVRHLLRIRTLDAMLGRGRHSPPDAFVQLGTRGVDAIETYLATYLPALVLSVGAPMALLAWMMFTDPWSARCSLYLWSCWDLRLRIEWTIRGPNSKSSRITSVTLCAGWRR
jgi:ABC-type transport system involved in cytochrome bd biosynthesis fused ATPase/permease subunit